MKTLVATGVVAMALAGGAAAQDWDYDESAGTGRIAMVRYDEGTAVVVQCKERELKVLVMGLPNTWAAWRRFDATRADGREDQQAWASGEAPNTIYSVVPGRDARFLRGGGRYELRARPVEGLAPVTAIFDLPTEWANLDRVLRGCGRPVEEARDNIPRVTDDDFAPLAQGAPAPAIPQPSSVDFHADVSCIVRDLTLTLCRLEGMRPVMDRELARMFARSVDGKRLDDADPAKVEGRILYSTIIATGVRP